MNEIAAIFLGICIVLAAALIAGVPFAEVMGILFSVVFWIAIIFVIIIVVVVATIILLVASD
jgi:hypothetical protein